MKEQTSKMKRFAKFLKAFNYFWKILHFRCLSWFWIRLCCGSQFSTLPSESFKYVNPHSSVNLMVPFLHKKMPKRPRDIIILQKCSKNHGHMLYCFRDMARYECNCYFSFWDIFCSFTPLNSPKNEIIF